ncbi:MAG: PAC2 family protein, partial [Candidatus Micrarchaeaceae archaeon]
LLNNSFYLIKRKNQDIVLLTGDVQAMTQEAQYAINDEVVDFFSNKLGGKFIFTVGGYNSGDSSNEKPRVFANATDPSVFKSFKNTDIVIGKSRGTIMGSAGMLLAFAKMKKIPGICLMGETRIMDLDAAAAKAVLMVLSEVLKLKVDMNNIDLIIKNTAEAIKAAEKQMASQGAQAVDGEVQPSYIR